MRKAERNGEMAIASISLWELALLYERRKLRTSGTIESSIRAVVEKSRVEVLELTPEIAARTTTFRKPIQKIRVTDRLAPRRVLTAWLLSPRMRGF